jgi:hypothetical protein
MSAIFATGKWHFALAQIPAALQTDPAFQASSPKTFKGRSFGIGPFFCSSLVTPEPRAYLFATRISRLADLSAGWEIPAGKGNPG